LLYEHEIGESMGHYETRELEKPYRPHTSQYINLNSIASPDDEYEILAFISSLAERLRE
jgi:hypothetical protein